jgi:hypothetical protein
MILPVCAFLIALAIGGVAALVGLGGGFLYVPTLTLLFGLDQKTAVGTSLAVTICASAAATLYCARQKKILYTAAVFLVIPGMVGAIAGSLLTGYIDNRVLVVLFVTVLLFIAIRMLVFPESSVPKPSFGWALALRPGDTGDESSSLRIPVIHLILWGFCGGLVAGTTGISGGVLFVPALVAGGVPLHYAVATSLFAIVLTSLAGAGTQAVLGNISIPFLATYGAGAAIGAYAGAAVAQKIPAGRIRVLFGSMLIVIAFLVTLRSFM